MTKGGLRLYCILLLLMWTVAKEEIKLNRNETSCKEKKLSDLIDTVFPEGLPPDLQPLVKQLEVYNNLVPEVNCSDALSLKTDMEKRVANKEEPHNSFRALYAFAELKYHKLSHQVYIPRINADIVILTGAFPDLKHIFERKLHLFFFYYGNWRDELLNKKFPFANYTNPRLLFLDMACQLVLTNNYNVYKRATLNFLKVKNHKCLSLETRISEIDASSSTTTVPTRDIHSFAKNVTNTTVNKEEDYAATLEQDYPYNLTVWDVVEIVEGPCKEGERHVVRLNIESILTAFDDGADQTSISFFKKLYENVADFPIEDYNARGELLKDLLLAMAEKVEEPRKKTIENLLSHVKLSGVGAWPPKIKLLCASTDSVESET